MEAMQLHSNAHSLTGPVVQLFAFHLGGSGLHPRDAHTLTRNRVLLLAMSCYKIASKTFSTFNVWLFNIKFVHQIFQRWVAFNATQHFYIYSFKVQSFNVKSFDIKSLCIQSFNIRYFDVQ